VAWDSTRPVPWRRLIREWLLYVTVMAVVFVIFFRDGGLLGILAGLLVSGPLYVALGFVLAKFGYQRKSWKELRAEPRPARSSRDGDDAAAVTGPKPKAAPTRRTGAAAGRPGGARKKKR
jgi:hypothetical protein